MERSVPKSINYQDVLPLSVPAISRRRRFFPQNGTSFSYGGSNEIRIEIGSINSLLDTQHSYLEFEVVRSDPAGGAQSFGFDTGGGAIMFDTLRVEQGGRVLSEIQSYNRLNAAVLDPCQVSFNGKLTESLTQGQKGLQNFAGGVAGAIGPLVPNGTGNEYVNSIHNSDLQIGQDQFMKFTMPIINGLFTQDKLIPLPLVRQDAPITLVLSITNPVNVGVWSAAPVANSLTIRKISYVAQLIEVGRDVLDQIKQTQEIMGGQLAISGQDWEHTGGLIPAGTANEFVVRLPTRKRSINSLFFITHSSNYGRGAVGLAVDNVYNMSYSGSANIDTYQLKAGSVVYPPTPIKFFGSFVDPELERGEGIMELAKAFGTLGFVNPTGRLNTMTYGTDIVGMGDGDNGDGAANTLAPGSDEPTCFCPIGLDTTSFQHEAIEAGIDTQTLSLESNLILNIDAAGSGGEDKNVSMWVLFDQHYYFNNNGMVTYSN